MKDLFSVPEKEQINTGHVNSNKYGTCISLRFTKNSSVKCI